MSKALEALHFLNSSKKGKPRILRTAATATLICISLLVTKLFHEFIHGSNSGEHSTILHIAQEFIVQTTIRESLK